MEMERKKGEGLRESEKGEEGLGERRGREGYDWGTKERREKEGGMEEGRRGEREEMRKKEEEGRRGEREEMRKWVGGRERMGKGIV